MIFHSAMVRWILKGSNWEVRCVRETTAILKELTGFCRSGVTENMGRCDQGTRIAERDDKKGL